MAEIAWQDFEKIELRAGTVVRCEPFPEARKAAYKLWIDLDPLGVKQSSAQITAHYSPEQLIGKQVLCVTNFPKKHIGPFVSEVLTTGLVLPDDTIVLASTERAVPNGARLA